MNRGRFVFGIFAVIFQGFLLTLFLPELGQARVFHQQPPAKKRVIKKRVPVRRKKVRRRRRQVASIMPQGRLHNFSKTLSHFIDKQTLTSFSGNTYLWESESPINFNELIISWNALRPLAGSVNFYVSVKHYQWSPWHRIAQWGPNFQKTFLNKLNPYVHTKHVRVETQKNILASAFRIKAEFSDGAPKDCLTALFACVSNMNNFGVSHVKPEQQRILIDGVPRQSQMVVDHPRAHELCSPASTSMLVSYFNKKLPGIPGAPFDLQDYVKEFAGKVHDKGTLDIYGNWLLNVAQAHDSSKGNVFYRVERINNFTELCNNYLAKHIPVAVSVRKLRGGATPYTNGHFMVVVGWDAPSNSVICIDPAFKSNKQTLKSYNLRHFLEAWGLSRHLSYVPIPKAQAWDVVQASM